MKDAIKKFLDSYEKEFAEAGKQLNHMDMPALTEELFSQYELTGVRLGYENVYFMRRKFLSVYAVLSVLYERKDDIKKLEYVLECICEEECWALPAHVNRKDENWRITIDLFAAETAFSLAEIIGRLKTRLAKAVYAKVKDEVFRRVLTPFMESKAPYAWWETSNMNWCAVCSGSIGAAAIWLMKDDQSKLDRLLERVCTSIMNYMDGFCEDGACLEGLGYYIYGMSFFAAFADLAYKYSDGRIDLLFGEKIRKIALFQQTCFLTGSVSLSFSDGSSQERYRMGLTSYLARKFGNITFPDISMAAGLESDNCYRYVILSRDILWTKEYLEWIQNSNKKIPTAEEMERYHIVLPDAQWSVCKSKNNCVMAAKGGHNEEPHNHNDVGSIIYAADGEVILADLGAGEYTKDYFNHNRYDNLCCRSRGHNVPLIDGREQCAGAQYRASRFDADGNGKTVIGMECAYGLSDGEQITRIIFFDLNSGDCRITDRFTLQKGRNITENLVSVCKPEIIGKSFFINTSRSRYEIKCSDGAGHRVLEEEYTDHFGKKKQVWLMQWEVMDQEGNIIIC